MATESLDKSLSRISEKMHVLAQRYDTVCQERTQALERIAELERELRDKEQRIAGFGKRCRFNFARRSVSRSILFGEIGVLYAVVNAFGKGVEERGARHSEELVVKVEERLIASLVHCAFQCLPGRQNDAFRKEIKRIYTCITNRKYL